MEAGNKPQHTEKASACYELLGQGHTQQMWVRGGILPHILSMPTCSSARVKDLQPCMTGARDICTISVIHVLTVAQGSFEVGHIMHPIVVWVHGTTTYLPRHKHSLLLL